jgi:pimeloyl-ACP methyl ester carboxylesterase
LFAIDLPGFGASERRDDLMSPRAMGGFLAALIAEADLGKSHIVAPDVGTSAALFATRHIPSGSRAWIVGTGGARSRSISENRCDRGVSTPTSTSTAGWTRA